MVSHARTLFCGEQTNATVLVAKFLPNVSLNEVQCFKSLLNSIEYTITNIVFYYFPCQKILLGQSNSDVPLVTFTSKVVVYFLAERQSQGEGTQPPSLLSPPGPGSVRLCNAMESRVQ
jgi:hypothetical protein